jgi:hypothetical protein
MRDISVSRNELMALINIERATFDTRARRGLFPFLVAKREEESGRRNYDANDAFLTMIADELQVRTNMQLQLAVSLAVSCHDHLVPRWATICNSSLEILEGRNADEILVGAFELLRGRKASWLTISGSAEEIGKALINYGPIQTAALINASRVAAAMRKRADEKKIDVSVFFSPNLYKKG